MANPTYTRKANATIVLMRIGSGSWAANDDHLTIGKASGTGNIGQAEVRIPEASWPSAGRLVQARLTVHESGTGAHSEFRGGSPRASIKRLSEAPKFSVPSTSDGYYTQQGSGDKYPGVNVAGADVQFNVNGSETADVSAMVEAMLPGRIQKRNGSPCDNQIYGGFKIRSSDESSTGRSFILTTDITLTVEIDVRVTPGNAAILDVIGAQDNTSDPTIVGSTDGRTLQVRFGFAAGPGETCSKAELAMYGVGATDAVPGTLIRTSGNVASAAGGGQNIYTATLSGLPRGTEGRWRLRPTSSTGKQGAWTSLGDSAAHVKLATISGPPLDIVFQPFADNPHILFSLNDPDPTAYLTAAEIEAALLPDGTLGWASGMVGIGGTTRRADLTWGGVALGPGQVISYRVRTRNQDQVVGQWSAPQRVTVYEAQAVTFSPSPGRLLSPTATITTSFPLADGARLRILDATDDSLVLYDSGPIVLVNQTSHAFVVPAGKVAWGQAFRAVGSYVPDGGGTTYLAESQPVAYTIANLPTTALSVPGAVLRRVATTDPVWQRAITDPDGAAIAAIEQEIRVAATPQGSGTLVIDEVDLTAAALHVVVGGTIPFGTSVDSRARAKNDTGTFGPWSPWLTITALQAPTVDLITPADGATIVDPTATLDWSVTGYGGRTQASAVVGIYTTTGDVLASLAVTTASVIDVPAYLVATDTSYLWDVTDTDTLGMVTRSAQRSFTTAFTETLPIAALSAEADPDTSTVSLAWGADDEPYPYNHEVTWIADDGSPVRIDGGPESLLDGNVPFTGTSLTHLGARLGDNVYYVAVSNGWRSSAPVSVTVTLDQPAVSRGFWQIVTDGVFLPLRVTGAPRTTPATVERMQAPGGQPREIQWGLDARTISATIDIRPVTDGPLSTELRQLMADAIRGRAASPVWLKPPAGWMWDPVWMTLQSFTDTPGIGGRMAIDMAWAELGDPLHAILPPATPDVPSGAGNIYVTSDALDFGSLVVGS